VLRRALNPMPFPKKRRAPSAFFRSEGIGTGLQIFDLTRFLGCPSRPGGHPARRRQRAIPAGLFSAPDRSEAGPAGLQAD
jgi:hypothetical protein